MAAVADKHEGRVCCVVAAVDGLWLVDVTVSEVFHPRARSPLCRVDVWSMLQVHVRTRLLRASMSPCLQVCADGWMHGWMDGRVLPLHLGRGAAWPYANMQSLVFSELWWLLTLSIGAADIGWLLYVCMRVCVYVYVQGVRCFVRVHPEGPMDSAGRRCMCVCTGSIFFPFAHGCECVYERHVHQGTDKCVRKNA